MTDNRLKTSIYLTAEMRQDLQDLADEHSRSLNGEMTEALKRYIQAEKKGKRKMKTDQK